MIKRNKLICAFALALSTSTLAAWGADKPVNINPMQEQTVGGGYQQKAAASQAKPHTRVAAPHRTWSQTTSLTCVRGTMTLNIADKNSACPQGFKRK